MKKMSVFLCLFCACVVCQYVTAAEQKEYDPRWYQAPVNAEKDWWKTAGGPTIDRANFFADIVGLDEQTFKSGHAPMTPPQWRDFDWANKVDKSILDTSRKTFITQTTPRSAAIFQGTLYVNSLFRLYVAYTKNLDITRLKEAGAQQDVLSNYNLCTKPTLLRDEAHLGNPAYLKVLIEHPDRPWEVDIRYQQANPGNRLAVFQIASTFEGPLEGGMANANALLTDMLSFAVQGEEASISTAGATIYRKYFLGTPLWLLHFLTDVKSVLVKEKGRYGHKISAESATGYQHLEGHEQNVQIGFHDNVVVTGGYGDTARPGRGQSVQTAGAALGQQQWRPIFLDANQRVDMNDPRNQIISQVFTAAYNTGDLRWAGQLNENAQALCKMLLWAGYASTLLAAKLAGKPRVFLTLLGGGAFQNDIRWIAQAFNTPIAILGQEFKLVDFIKNNNLQVTLVYRPDKVRPGTVQVRSATGDAEFLKTMAGIAAKIAGKGQDRPDPAFLGMMIGDYTQKAYAFKAQEDVVAKEGGYFASEERQKLAQLRQAYAAAAQELQKTFDQLLPGTSAQPPVQPPVEYRPPQQKPASAGVSWQEAKKYLDAMGQYLGGLICKPGAYDLWPLASFGCELVPAFAALCKDAERACALGTWADFQQREFDPVRAALMRAGDLFTQAVPVQGLVWYLSLQPQNQEIDDWTRRQIRWWLEPVGVLGVTPRLNDFARAQKGNIENTINAILALAPKANVVDYRQDLSKFGLGSTDSGPFNTAVMGLAGLMKSSVVPHVSAVRRFLEPIARVYDELARMQQGLSTALEALQEFQRSQK